MLYVRLFSRGFARLSSRSRETAQQNEPRLLKVAIIGMPNAGKSTLINTLMESEVCPVSKRVHTTRESQKAVYLRDNTQLVFVDTPGVVNRKEVKKFKFSPEFANGPQKAIEEADVIGVIHDISNRILRHKLDPRVVHVLDEFPNKNFILILNKVDTLKTKRSLLDAVRFLTKSTVGGVPIPVKFPHSRKELTASEILERGRIRQSSGKDIDKHSLEHLMDAKQEVGQENEYEFEANGWAGFRDVFMISALNGDGLEVLKNYFVVNAHPAPWEFSEDVLTDCPPMQLALRILQSKLLEYLPSEIPYSVTPSLEYWEEETESETMRIVFAIKCPKERFAKVVIGHGGSHINQIKIGVEKDLAKLLQKPIDLHIHVIVEEKTKKVSNNPSENMGISQS